MAPREGERDVTPRKERGVAPRKGGRGVKGERVLGHEMDGDWVASFIVVSSPCRYPAQHILRRGAGTVLHAQHHWDGGHTHVASQGRSATGRHCTGR